MCLFADASGAVPDCVGGADGSNGAAADGVAAVEIRAITWFAVDAFAHAEVIVPGGESVAGGNFSAEAGA